MRENLAAEIIIIEYPPATSVLRSLTFGRLAGTAIAEHLAKKNSGGSARHIVPVSE